MKSAQHRAARGTQAGLKIREEEYGAAN